VNKDAGFSLFGPPEDEGPMVVVFLPMLEHPSVTLSFHVQNTLTKPNNQSSKLEIKALTSKKRVRVWRGEIW